jgi:hypothetical protein
VPEVVLVSSPEPVLAPESVPLPHPEASREKEERAVNNPIPNPNKQRDTNK